MEKKQKKEYAKIIVLSILILLFAISICFTSLISANIKKILYKADFKVSNDDLVVHYIRVGQGDAIALQLPNNKTMMIDSGPKDSQNVLITYIKDEVLKSTNDLAIDYLILTHPDTDHSGGMSAIFAEFEVKNFFRPNIASDSEDIGEFAMKSTLVEYDEVINKSKEEKDLQANIINIEYEFYIDNILVQIFPPLKVYDTTNEMSPIIKITYLGKSFLFTGDIQGESEDDLLNYYKEKLDADVLKVAHHGSNTSTSVEFATMVSPEYAIICVGSNSYGHPHFTTITTLQNVGAQVLTTEGSTIRFVCGKEMFVVLEENKTHSFVFVDWWIVGLVIEIVLVIWLIKAIIKVVKLHKDELKDD
ncbi:MAG: MBL fold metallo-hydrolase [Clostridia bacterium]|nr:MBL fold metallo-hydrolase [Clostridia bacterium]